MAGRVVRTYDPRGVRKVSERAKKMFNVYSPKLGYPYPDLEKQTKSYPEREGSRVTEKALNMIETMPRVALNNIKRLPSEKKKVSKPLHSSFTFPFVHVFFLLI